MNEIEKFANELKENLKDMWWYVDNELAHGHNGMIELAIMEIDRMLNAREQENK